MHFHLSGFAKRRLNDALFAEPSGYRKAGENRKVGLFFKQAAAHSGLAVGLDALDGAGSTFKFEDSKRRKLPLVARVQQAAETPVEGQPMGRLIGNRFEINAKWPALSNHSSDGRRHKDKVLLAVTVPGNTAQLATTTTVQQWNHLDG